MPMTTTNVPHLREQNVAEAPKKTEAPKVEAKPALASAAASGDPTVHRLLALIEAHESNGDTEKVAAARKELADLGYQ